MSQFAIKSPCYVKTVTRSHSVKSYASPFQGGNAGSNPAGDAKKSRGYESDPFNFSADCSKTVVVPFPSIMFITSRFSGSRCA